MSSKRQSSRSRSKKRPTVEAPRMNGFYGISESARMFGGSTLMTDSKLNLSKEKLLLDDSNKSGNSATDVGAGGGGGGGGGGGTTTIRRGAMEETRVEPPGRSRSGTAPVGAVADKGSAGNTAARVV